MSTNFIKIFFFLLFFLNFSVMGESLYSWEYYLKKSKIEYDQQMYNFAIENLEKTILLNPDSAEAYNYLGLIYQKKQKYKLALEYFIKSLSLDNRQDKIHFYVGQLQDYFFNQKEAYKHYSESIKINPKNIKSLLGLARHLSINEKFNDSEIYFNKAYELGKIKSEKIYNQAVIGYSQKKYKKALSLLDRVIEENPAQVEAYFIASDINRLNKNYKNAIKYLEKLKFIKPHYYKTYLYIGKIYFNHKISSKRKRQVEVALYNTLKSLELKPNNIEAYELLLEIYNFLNNYEKIKEISIKLNKLYQST